MGKPRGEFMRYAFRYIATIILSLTLASAAWAQWSSDPSKNLPLADKGNGNDQVQAKVKPLANDGWYVSWFDSDPKGKPPIGYSVFFQRLSPGGVEKLPHDGIEVAHLGNSSTEDYGLDVDTSGNALLAFLDDREGPNQQVTAAKMSPSGKALWGNLGVQLTHNAGSHHAPKIAGTSDGNVVVAWIGNNDVVLQKLDPNGQPLWGKGIVLSESGFNYGLADLHAADNGSVIVSWIRAQGYGSNRYIYANKLSASGQLMWGKKHVKVFNNGSLQFGAYPYFVPDGNGGAVFAWYTSIPALQCFAQHIRADGSEAFPHNGSAASTNTTRVRVSPAASYRAATDEVFLFWTEEDSNQVLNGVYAQKFNGKGKRVWGDSGLQVVPLGADQQMFVQNVQVGAGALAFWVDQVTFGSSTIQATRLNRQGKVVCQQFPVSSLPANKARLSSDIVPSGLSAVAWEDDRIGNNGIYIQNVNRDCSLGQLPH
jgi:hypothetical protein